MVGRQGWGSKGREVSESFEMIDRQTNRQIDKQTNMNSQYSQVSAINEIKSS